MRISKLLLVSSLMLLMALATAPGYCATQIFNETFEISTSPRMFQAGGGPTALALEAAVDGSDNDWRGWMINFEPGTRDYVTVDTHATLGSKCFAFTADADDKIIAFFYCNAMTDFALNTVSDVTISCDFGFDALNGAATDDLDVSSIFVHANFGGASGPMATCNGLLFQINSNNTSDPIVSAGASNGLNDTKDLVTFGSIGDQATGSKYTAQTTFMKTGTGFDITCVVTKDGSPLFAESKSVATTLISDSLSLTGLSVYANRNGRGIFDNIDISTDTGLAVSDWMLF